MQMMAFFYLEILVFRATKLRDNSKSAALQCFPTTTPMEIIKLNNSILHIMQIITLQEILVNVLHATLESISQ